MNDRLHRGIDDAGQGEPELVLSVVGYVDVLGSTDMMLQDKSGEGLRTVFRAVKKAQPHIEADDDEGWGVRIFTDNLVYCCRRPAGPDEDLESEIGHALSVLGRHQAQMAMDGFFCRGGLALGLMYMDDVVVYGPGLIEAYKLETSAADVPRIVLSADAEQLVLAYLPYYADPSCSPQNAYLLRDADGLVFVNYLGVAVAEADDKDQALSLLADHRDQTRQRLEEFRSAPKVRRKYEWVANYHNHVCRTMRAVGSEFLIDVDLIASTPPTPIVVPVEGSLRAADH